MVTKDFSSALARYVHSVECTPGQTIFRLRPGVTLEQRVELMGQLRQQFPRPINIDSVADQVRVGAEFMPAAVSWRGTALEWLKAWCDFLRRKQF